MISNFGIRNGKWQFIQQRLPKISSRCAATVGAVAAEKIVTYSKQALTFVRLWRAISDVSGNWSEEFTVPYGRSVRPKGIHGRAQSNDS
jgi:hypothetical protein